MRAENPSRHGAGPSVGIAGAGLLGRLLAWRLAHAGWRVAVFDPAESAEPVFRSQAGDPYVPTAAGFTAAGMLSPLAELDNAAPDATKFCAMAKLHVTDRAFDVANGCLQLHGGYGYLADYGIEKLVRDLRVHQILEGTNEIMRLIVSRTMLAERG